MEDMMGKRKNREKGRKKILEKRERTKRRKRRWRMAGSEWRRRK